MNPALPGGASGAEDGGDDGAWSASGRLAYTFLPYGRLQQGTEPAPNPNELAIDVHLGTLQLEATAPTRTSLDVQLPFGTLVTRSIDDNRTDTGLGDLELRVVQALPALAGLAPRIALGAVLPTGAYVARSGAANLPPEASYLTLGRGTAWWIAEGDARYAINPRVATFAQLSARGPLAQTRDDFGWGSEVRGTLGARVALTRTVSAIVTSDLQWRDGASEPDPFAGGRLPVANAGGWQWAVSPAALVKLPQRIALAIGLRVPVFDDVVGNQLVSGLGGFVAVSYARAIAPHRPRAVEPERGRITVVDYWASWCAPCVEISRALDAAAPRWPDVRIVRVDATSWPAAGPQLPAGARGLPVIELFDRSGARTAMLVGDAARRVVDEVEALRRLSPERSR